MSVLNQTNPTLLDQIRRTDPNGKIAPVVEKLQIEKPLLQDAVILEGNLPDGHTFVSRESLPSVASRRFNEGYAASKSSTAQTREPCTMFGAHAVIDAKLAQLNGNEAAFRMSENTAFMEALGQRAAKALILDRTTNDPRDITGILRRFESTSDAKAGKQIVVHDGEASGSDSMSLLLVGWGEQGVHGIFPKGSKGGIQHTDLSPNGPVAWDDGSGKKYPALVDFWEWQLGLVVKDVRAVSVVRNIDMGNLSDTGNALIKSMIKAFHLISTPANVRLAWYVPRAVATYLHLQALDSTKNSTLTIENVGGKPVTSFLGAPVRVEDTLNITENPIS